jgi:hypothetical protein
LFGHLESLAAVESQRFILGNGGIDIGNDDADVVQVVGQEGELRRSGQLDTPWWVGVRD